jgi:class 3 adenylate cyclase
MSAIAISEPSSFDGRTRSRANDTGTWHQISGSLPSSLGEDFQDYRRRANARQRKASVILTVPIVALFGIVDAYMVPEAKTLLWLIRFGVLMPTVFAVLAVSLMQPAPRWSEAAVAFGVFVAGGCVVAMALIAPIHYAGILLVVFASYTFLGLPFIHAITAGMGVTVFYAVVAIVDGSAPRAVVASNIFFLTSCNVIGAFVCYVLEEAARRQFFRNHLLNEQSQRSERLLRNVFPVSVAQRLKSRSEIIADACPDVSILFADIVDFTPLAATVSPERLVQLLDEIFTAFDRLARKHGLEKIKTIGDAYMVAGGLRGRASGHVRAVAEMALDMIDSVAKVEPGDGKTMALRIGIHTGPVVAGVIGRTKFAYDVWGDTVNVASRLEEITTPGTIMVSESTHERLRGNYAFSLRQVISVKGRGALPCYQLLGRTTAAQTRLGTDYQATQRSMGALVPTSDASFRVKVA